MKIDCYAGIDIGSNGVRLLIMNVYVINDQAHFDKAILVRAPIRLGSDSFVKNEIQEDNIEMLSEAMKSFYSLMKCYKVKKYRACATSALREASNALEVVETVYKNSEIKIDLIEGKEEAKIIYTTQIAEYIKDEINLLNDFYNLLSNNYPNLLFRIIFIGSVYGSSLDNIYYKNTPNLA